MFHSSSPDPGMPTPEGGGREPMPLAVRRRSKLRRWFIGLLAILCSAFVLYVFRGPCLRSTAELWIVNDPVQPADAIVVLGGSMETRPFEAARLYRDGMAPRVLIMNVRPGNTTSLGLTPNEAEIERQILVKGGVPNNSIVAIGQEVQSTHDEALTVRKWAQENHPSRIIITTDIFHTRRVRWLFHKTLKNAGVAVIVHPAPARDYSNINWWQNEQGFLAFQNEIVKYVYYRLKY